MSVNIAERTSGMKKELRRDTKKLNMFTLCCSKWKIKLPHSKDPPTMLKEYLFGSGSWKYL